MGVINTGSVDDIRSTLKLGMYSIEQLRKEIKDEIAGQNRASVIKMLTGRINKMMLSTKKFK